jgi:hypothetical protein
MDRLVFDLAGKREREWRENAAEVQARLRQEGLEVSLTRKGASAEIASTGYEDTDMEIESVIIGAVEDGYVEPGWSWGYDEEDE